MNYGQHIRWTFVVYLFLALVACVPVEEKVQVPFDAGMSRPEIRQVLNLQQAQHADSLVALLTSEDPAQRYAAVRAFASFQDTTLLSSLLPLLTDANGEVRMMAAYTIGQLGVSGAEGQLTSAFDGRDSARLYELANGMILEAMGRIGSASSLRALSTISTYQSIDTFLLLGQVRGIYRYALRGMTDPEGTSTMVRYLSDPAIPLRVRVIAANYLHRAQGLDLAPHADQLIANWHAERHPYLRMCLATALGKIKSPAALKILAENLSTESDYRVQCNMIRALQQYDYTYVQGVLMQAVTHDNPHIAELAAQYFVQYGREKDAAKYKSAITDCKTWQARVRMAEAANMYLTSMFSGAKTSLQNEIQAELKKATNPYEKAGWLKAWGSELRNFESLPKYFQADEHAAVRTQAVTSLIEACKNKHFDVYFAGEGHLIKNQIGGYLIQAVKTGDAGLIALVAGAITDDQAGLKNVMAAHKADLNKALAGLKLPDEMETYLELSKALNAYGMESPAIPEDQKRYRPIDWTILDGLKPGSRVLLSTSQGDITITLFPERAPATVSSFIKLVREGYYAGKAFHRVVPNFVVQTGCPRGDGYGSLDFTLRSELAQAYYEEEGYVGMASAGLHTEGTQFFITHCPTPHLDGRYTIFGKVISGMDVVHRITMGDSIKQITILN